MPKLWYVATYGDLGLDIAFYSDPLEYGRALAYARREHSAGAVDTYQYGEVSVDPPRTIPTRAQLDAVLDDPSK
jgi:hypothetical protein